MENDFKERIFWSTEGWYIYLRQGDEKLVSFVGLRKLRVHVGNFGIITGPFKTKLQADKWFEGFLSEHSRPRVRKHFKDENLIIPKTIDYDFDAVITK